MDEIDTAIIAFFKANNSELSVKEVYKALSDGSYDINEKRVRTRLKSLVRHSYLDSRMVKGIPARHKLLFRLKEVEA